MNKNYENNEDFKLEVDRLLSICFDSSNEN